MSAARVSEAPKASRAGWAVAAAILLFGLLTADYSNVRWLAMAVALFSVPLLAQLTPWTLVRVYALWFGALLVLQSVLSPIVMARNYVTLPPELDVELTLEPGELPGVAGRKRITADAQGFRVTKPVNYVDKPGDTYRIFAVGGSTTEQILLDDRQTWTHLLQARLDAAWRGVNVEVVNTGVSGVRATQHIATLRRILDYQPDLVVFLVGINDWNYHVKEVLGHPEGALDAIKLRRTMLGEVLVAAEGAVTGEEASEEGTFTSDYYTGQMGALERGDVREFRPGEPSEDYRRDMQTIARLCVENAVQCMLMSQPTAYATGAPSEVTRRFWMTPPSTEYTLDLGSLEHVAGMYNDFLRVFAYDEGLEFCDLAAEFTPTLDLFYDDCHFTQRGAEIAAAALAGCVLRSQARGAPGG